MSRRHLALLLACWSTACVKDVRYRYFPEQSCGKQPCINLPAREHGPGWELAYLEFNDAGNAWDELQTTRALDLINAAKADNQGAVVVLLYIHGWKNNANQSILKPKDVEKFHTALDRVATELPPQPGKLPRLVGIYVGWRGGTIDVEPLKTLTYWPRRATARRVGRKALFDSIARIIDTTKPPGDDRSKLILVGHSFGSRVLENAVDEVDARRHERGRMLQWHEQLILRQSEATLTPTAAPSPPADLIVFVNAATQSSISEKTIRRLQESHYTLYAPGMSPEACADDPQGDRRVECRPLPLYVAVSSTGDGATRFVLPIANAILPPAPLPLRLRSAAFTPRLRSHEVVEVSCPVEVPYRCAPHGATELCFEANRDESRMCYDVRRRPNASNETAFWVMTVDPRVVTDHGDIWNQNLLDLFESVLQRTSAADPTVTRTSIQR